VTDVLALALALPAFPLHGAPRMTDCIFLDEFTHRVVLEALFQQALADPLVVEAVENALDVAGPTQDVEPQPMCDALLAPPATQRLASFRRLYSLYTAKLCGELVDSPYTTEAARRYLLAAILKVSNSLVDDVPSGVRGLSHFPYDATTGCTCNNYVGPL
jgi:hypothetical protein